MKDVHAAMVQRLRQGYRERQIDTELLRKVLVAFIREEVHKVGLRHAVFGLSGGVDSALVATLAAAALGPENVWGLILPYRTSDPRSTGDAALMVEKTGIQSLRIDISAQIDAYFAGSPEATMLQRGNKMARERMSILYDRSAALGALVLGTSNKTELFLGYGTIHGDLASAINPIGDLYKTQVWALAAAMGVPAGADACGGAQLTPRRADDDEQRISSRFVAEEDRVSRCGACGPVPGQEDGGP